MDRTERVLACTRLYALQHGFFALSCFFAFAALSSGSGTEQRSSFSVLLLLCGAAAGVGASGSSLSVEREWATCLCAGNGEHLALLSARLRAVDLTCLLLSPIAASLLLQFAGARLAVLVFLACNAAAYLSECRLLTASQRAAPALQAEKPPPGAKTRGSFNQPLRSYLNQPALGLQSSVCPFFELLSFVAG